VIAGAGVAGYRTARTSERPTRHEADITPLHPTDYFLYLPLLPQAAAGILEPLRVTALTYDRLVPAVGGVNKLLPVPDPYVRVPGRPEAYACGDAAAIPLSGPPPGPSPAALDTASPEPARAAGSPRDFASRPEGDS
jgi:NADH dehydrogenase FAD-containing subunit